MKEDAAAIEAAVLAEIKQALNFGRQPQPPTTITIPSIGLFPSRPSKQNDASIEQTASTETDSIDDQEHLILIKVEEAVARRGFDNAGYSNDSFMRRLSTLSLGSSGVHSQHGSAGPHSQHGSQKFYIGTVDEEGSVPSRVSNLEADEMSHGELMDLVQRLYGHLKQSDSALSTERERRKSRERSLIKLAKELAARKDTIRRLMGQNEELKEELRMLRAEKSLLTQRLEHQLQISREQKGEKDETRQDLELELAEAQALYKSECAEHDDRIIDINRSHANQCEQLCREVVQANSESLRLQKKLSEFTRGAYSIDRSIVTLRSSAYSIDSEKPPSKRKRRRKMITKCFLFILTCAVFALYGLDCVPTNKEAIFYPLHRHTLHIFTTLKGISALNGISLTDGMSALKGSSWTDGTSALKGISWTDGMSALKGISWTDGMSALKGISWTGGMSALHGMSFTDISTTEDTTAITPLVLTIAFPEDEAVNDLEVELKSELRQGSSRGSQGKLSFAGWLQFQVSALERFFKQIVHKWSENHEHKVRLGKAFLIRE